MNRQPENMMLDCGVDYMTKLIDFHQLKFYGTGRTKDY